ncbi:hypothetical protein [Glycomyces xiaoerkulensis]|uniref:hypothetical protein n=1 Tax=Glycomyces xiaoerkulensis TaxID=2038139 RepID=UPI000C260FB5|nr:hypothetical protein [Glycomyces xiaoerkulensis]
MVSHPHEIPIRLFQNRPELAAELLVKRVGADLPAYASAESESEALTDNDPIELNCDNVSVFRDAVGNAVYAIITEVQRSEDAAKSFSWPMYLTILRKRLQCPVRLLVVCTDDATAHWARRPIEIGPPGFTLLADVIGPEELIQATDEQEAHEAAELLILAAAMVRKGPQGDSMAHALGRRLNELSEAERRKYAGWAWRLLSQEACRVLEEYMSLTYQEYLESPAGQLELRGERRGELRGEIRALLKLVELRGIEVSAEARERIESCTDSGQVERWFARAVEASSIDQILR